MIKVGLFSIVFLTCISAYCNENSDTLFIVREADSLHYHAIYIDTNRNSPYYNKITDNSFDPTDNLYREAISSLKNNSNSKFSKHHIEGISSDWFPLYFYKDQYYVYAPSEWGFNEWARINDSLMIDFTFNDGPSPSYINSCKIISGKEHQLNLTGPYLQPSILNIYLLDARKGIAVFEYPSRTRPYNFRLMVAKENIREFPLIVNYSKHQKSYELKFDEPDFKILLTQIKH